MRFSCTQENLNQGLSAVSHVAGKNANLPILGNVLIKADEKSLKFMSTNLEIAITCSVRGKVDQAGEFTVPSKLFSDYVSLLPKERVDVNLEGNAFAVSCGTYQTKLNGILASEFPLIPTIEAKEKFSIHVDEFRKAVGQVVFAVAPNESRPEISGVLLKFTPGQDGLELIMAATDSYRLAEKTIKVLSGTSITEPVSIIVPARTIAEFVRIIGVFKDGLDTAKNVEIQLGENQIQFVYDNTELVSRVIEGKYPDYRQLIPDKYETEVTVSKDEMARAVKTASLFSRTGLNDVNIRFNPPSGIVLNSVNGQTGEHSVSLEADISGRENAVTVNFKYFLDGVNNVESEDISIQMNDSMSPCIVRPIRNGKIGHDYLYIVMPIRQ